MCRGEAAEAEPAARESLALSRQLFPSLDDEVMLRNLRCVCHHCSTGSCVMFAPASLLTLTALE